jgi:hypothetical protein
VSNTPDSVNRQLSIEAPIGEVWQMITVAENLQAWYAFDGASVDLRMGGAIEHYWREHGRFRGVIEGPLSADVAVLLVLQRPRCRSSPRSPDPGDVSAHAHER